MKKIFNLIIVDESGSMSIIRKQAFAGMNETLKTIRALAEQEPEMEQHVSLLTFDTRGMRYKFDITPAAATSDLAWQDYNPCGGTPLYDAIGISVSKLNAQVGADDNVLVTIITDGEENCSREWTLTMVRTLIEKLKRQNWTFTLIGTDNLDVEGMAQDFAIDEHLKFAETPAATDAMFAQERKSRVRYSMCIKRGKKGETGTFFDN